MAGNVTEVILKNNGRGGQEPNWVVNPGRRRLHQGMGLISFISDSEEEVDKNII
jgi:hypothetical protein